ncbi:hypothetical protein BI364_07160 [Acidihalobacter yilgarnensis]|uniref:Uncharacterized protein n=2 Tax=Acidihalobacter yilgarnensis TaxID=2819280 RepID=A0A1D8IMX0_9GAMM|nr:hypothetical protein BI364_07160 [Acidihalobacter yilgarnensis]
MLSGVSGVTLSAPFIVVRAWLPSDPGAVSWSLVVAFVSAPMTPFEPPETFGLLACAVVEVPAVTLAGSSLYQRRFNKTSLYTGLE